MSEKIVQRDVVPMYEEGMSKYSIAVNRIRAIPNTIDGLKPIQRRIIYQAYVDHMIGPSNKKKSNKLAGQIMGLLHPHGDPYPSFVPMVAWYKTKYPPLFGHGNWGNPNTPEPASSRYTETALSKFGYDIFCEDLQRSKHSVTWVDTYLRDGTKEPEYLPVRLPMLLINGGFGIGLGLQFYCAPHNLSEVVKATRDLLKNPQNDVVLVPDFCQELEILNTDWKQLSHTGRGVFKVRGKITEEHNKKGEVILHVVSLPDNISGSKVYDKILAMYEDKQLPMVKDVLRNLDKRGCPDIIIHLRQGADPNYVKQVLYAKTEIMSTVSVNFEAVAPNGIDIKRYSYKEYLLEFIEQRMEVKFKLYCNLLQQALTRFNTIDAYIKVLESGKVESIIRMIRKAKGTEDRPLVEYIIKSCKMTDLQAKFIINAPLSRLSAGYLVKYRKERSELDKKIKVYTAMVTDDGSLIKAEIDQELVELEQKYRTPRLCKVIDSDKENEIPKGTFIVAITEKNFIRKLPDGSKVNVVRKDKPKHILKVDNAENILIFDNKGKVFSLPVSKIPICDKTNAGTDVRILIRKLTSEITAVYYEPIFTKIAKSTNKHYLVMLTKQNVIKKLDIKDFTNVTPSGLIYTKLKDQTDEVVSIILAQHNADVLITNDKKVLRAPLKEVSEMKRNAVGVRAMSGNLFMNSMSIIYPKTKYLVAVTKDGKVNKFAQDTFACHKRGTGGNNVVKLSDNDALYGIYGVDDGDHMHVLTANGVVDIDTTTIKTKSTVAAGTKMIKSEILKIDIVR